ncbi:MAG: NAD(P)H-dependent oxidoreductase [Candidatus Omnitrophota bacterium]
MKVAIIFYSFSGNTKSACLFLKGSLNSNGIAADSIELKPLREERSFFQQGRQAFRKHMPLLADVTYDLAAYDFVVFASPVWAFTIAPALRSYLKKAKGLENKKTACFVTHGSGLGSKKALRELEEILKSCGARILCAKDIAGNKAKDCFCMEENFKSFIDIVTARP